MPLFPNIIYVLLGIVCWAFAIMWAMGMIGMG